ncbi:MAG: hypothetical protein BWK78_10180 [Thiotrichaceae bacterium IS1]|nr:MAG: hypothetical protein BWK78_10180 [Thiotrichaceae bacterium IS1]
MILILFLAMPLCMAQGEGKFCGKVVDANGPAESVFKITDQPSWSEEDGVIGYEFKKDKGKICVETTPKFGNGQENYIVVVTPKGEPKKITTGCSEMGPCVSPPPPVVVNTGVTKWLEEVLKKEQTVTPGVTPKSGLPPPPKMLVPSGKGIRLVQGKPTLHLFLGECKGCKRNVGICEKVEKDCKPSTAVDQNGIISLKLLPSKLQANKIYSVVGISENSVELTVLDKLPPETELSSPKSLQDVVSQGCKIAQLGSTSGWNLEAYQQIVEQINTVKQDQKLKVFSGILEKVKNALQYPNKYELNKLTSACTMK